MFKKLLLSSVVAAAMILSACNAEPSQEPTAPSSEPVAEATAETYSIVVTSFHEYDWVMEILGENTDNFEVTLLMDTGVDIHSYEPTVEDITIIQAADLYIYNGGHSHAWVADAIAKPTNENFKAINVVERLGDIVVTEVLVEGMQVDGAEDEHEEEHAHEDEHEHEEEHAHEDEHEHEEEHSHEDEHEGHDHSEEGHAHDDEHVWLSLNNAMMVCETIGSEIGAIDSANADTYKANADAYIATLAALDAEYEAAIAAADRDTLIFADRFPFIYMMNDYDVNYFAAFQGCSAETEATFETVKFLTDKVDELDINTLLIIDNGLIELAKKVNNESEDKDSEAIVLNSMQSVSRADIDAGATYYGYMQENLETLKTALAE